METLASAAVEALFDPSVRGVQDWRGMGKLSESFQAKKETRRAAAAAGDSSSSTNTAGGGGGEGGL